MFMYMYVTRIVQWLHEPYFCQFLFAGKFQHPLVKGWVDELNSQRAKHRVETPAVYDVEKVSGADCLFIGTSRPNGDGIDKSQKIDK